MTGGSICPIASLETRFSGTACPMRFCLSRPPWKMLDDVEGRWDRRLSLMPAPRVTTHEYLRMPETVSPQELVYGLVRDAPAPSPYHQSDVGEIFVCLRAHLAQQGTGHVWVSPIDVVLDREQNLVVQPDLIVLLNERRHIVRERVWGAPDLVIEVMSPRPRIGSLEERLRWFAEYGVRECWLVRPASRQIEVIPFTDGHAAEPRVATLHESTVSAVLPELKQTPDAVLKSNW
jgi:Uma2 family endonuclease